jgi:hypothetical protein
MERNLRRRERVSGALLAYVGFTTTTGTAALWT